jgi:hypothetical protein
VVEIIVQVGSKAFAGIEAAFSHLERSLIESTERASVPLSGVMRDTIQLVADKIRREHSNPWNGSVVNPSNKLQVRSGGGIRSIVDSIKITTGRIEDIEGRISTGKMTVHETGATIRAKSARFLTIPLPSAMDSRGIPLRKRARDWDNTFVARSKRGNLLIFQKRGRNEIMPLYLLKPEVTLRPRLGMQQIVMDDALPYFERRAFETLERAIMDGL